MNELQHYGVKGMRWKHKRGAIKRAQNKAKPVMTTSKSQSTHKAGDKVPGQPYMVYTGNGDGMTTKSAYEEWQRIENDPVYAASLVVKDLPGDAINAGQSFLDDLFGVKRKKT